MASGSKKAAASSHPQHESLAANARYLQKYVACQRGAHYRRAAPFIERRFLPGKALAII
jgi:hypothetical protein